MTRICIIGAGAWGTALAAAARRAGCEVVIWAYEPEVAEAINTHQENTFYLPGVRLDAAITASADMAVAARAEAVLVVAPAQHVRAISTDLAGVLPADVPVVLCAKGIEQGTQMLMSEVLAETMPASPLAVLSGPTFAGEVARGLPAALTLACASPDLAAALQAALGHALFRIYLSDDVIGAQIGGAVKNVLAIACGIVEGRALGANARAALITRGLAEMTRFGVAKGAHMETLMGLSGLGDLVLTCTSMQSRNCSLGVALGRGEALRDILATRTSVAEGVHSASAVIALAERLGADMPICAAVHAIIDAGASVDEEIGLVLSRPLGQELDEPA
jgi:glycerol-3-phosphate dehydrogenase (NAD(P)+)